eukprot:364808-Chlamydomonas_euryale.AAC.11
MSKDMFLASENAALLRRDCTPRGTSRRYSPKSPESICLRIAHGRGCMIGGQRVVAAASLARASHAKSMYCPLYPERFCKLPAPSHSLPPPSSNGASMQSVLASRRSDETACTQQLGCQSGQTEWNTGTRGGGVQCALDD